MTSLIVIHAEFERHWPFVAEFFTAEWERQGKTELIRLHLGDSRQLGDVVTQPETITRLACLGVPADIDCIRPLTNLQEATFSNGYLGSTLSQAGQDYLVERNVPLYDHLSEGFWGESVSEFALGLTICGLRRIPQDHHSILTSHESWMRYRENHQGPGTLGHQFSDDKRFTCGTVEGKRVRIVGAGNIGSRYASFVKMMGADVAAWDPFAPEPNFHRAGSRREYYLEQLVKDAQIFAPMLPLTEQTRNLVTAELIDALPKGCLVVMATRAKICDMEAVRRRVLADELALAADVFDVEPLPLDDPLLGRHNVIHTPHIAGRTIDANRAWVERLTSQFRPR